MFAPFFYLALPTPRRLYQTFGNISEETARMLSLPAFSFAVAP